MTEYVLGNKATILQNPQKQQLTTCIWSLMHAHFFSFSLYLFSPYLLPSIKVTGILRAELIGPLKAEGQLILPSLPAHYGVQYLNSSICQQALENYCLSIRNLSGTNKAKGVKGELSSRSTGASGGWG